MYFELCTSFRCVLGLTEMNGQCPGRKLPVRFCFLYILFNTFLQCKYKKTDFRNFVY